MKRYWIDFSASMLVKAEDANEAFNKFWDSIPDNVKYVELSGVELYDKPTPTRPAIQYAETWAPGGGEIEENCQKTKMNELFIKINGRKK